MASNSSVNGGGGSTSVMVGATAGTAGTAGSAPAPAAGDQAKYLTGGGTWSDPVLSYGFANLASQALSAGSTAYVDVTGSSMALTPGVWQITYTVATDHTGNLASPTVANIVITTSANAIVDGSQSSRPGSNTSALILARVLILVVSTSNTYKMRMSNGDTSGALSVLNSTPHKSTLSWVKIG
jgi:hypothetical protein